ncbi:MAG: helix-turn-helix transcriptional regulator, partial [Clostridia bacterium]
MNYLSDFVDILNEYMEREDMTINQFSKRVGIVGNAISKWLSQEYFPTIDCVIKIADYMNCSIDYLFGFADSSAIQLSENSANFYDRFVVLLEKKH